MDVKTYPIDGAPPSGSGAPLPLVVYVGAVTPGGDDLADRMEALFTANQWVGCWRNGIFPFDHFHSTAHEVLGIYTGSARLLFGGTGGVEVEANPGDVLVIPAGMLHRRLGGRGHFGVVGAYPVGQQPDMCEAGRGDARWRAARIAEVPLPENDPVAGPAGPLKRSWLP